MLNDIKDMAFTVDSMVSSSDIWEEDAKIYTRVSRTFSLAKHIRLTTWIVVAGLFTLSINVAILHHFFLGLLLLLSTASFSLLSLATYLRLTAALGTALAVKKASILTTLLSIGGLIPPGDIMDRLTILSIKKKKLWNKLSGRTRTHLVSDMEDTWLFFLLQCEGEGILREECSSLKLEQLTRALLRSNERQWELEDKVRSETSETAALGARHQNHIRVELKNQINALFNYHQEIKDYKWELQPTE